MDAGRRGSSRGRNPVSKLWAWRLIGCLFLGVLSGGISQAEAVDRPAWFEIKSDHFIVHTASSAQSFGAEVIQKSEYYYDQIASWLGYARRGDFWTWDKRCKIYLYATREQYLTQTGQSGWSSGSAVLSRRMILSFYDAPDFLESVLPHELAHLIFRDYVGGDMRHIPLWLDEGVAMAQEKSRREEFDRLIKDVMQTETWIPMTDFMKRDSVAGLPGPEAARFYAQARSVVNFILRSLGSDRFIAFCRFLRDGNPAEDALRKSDPAKFKNIRVFETLWVEHEKNNSL